MCGRFSLYSSFEAIQEELDIKDIKFDYFPSYNIAPSQNILAIVKESPAHFEYLKWGLIPYWAKEQNIGYKMINAKSETIAEKPSFKKPFEKQRCLIIADGFFEWKKTKDGKIPYFIKLKTGKPFSFAGLFDIWRSPNGSEIKSCTIITCEPNELIKNIHDRMPVIMDKKARSLWLDNSSFNKESLLRLLGPFDPNKIEAYKVSSVINSPKNNSEGCIKPI